MKMKWIRAPSACSGSAVLSVDDRPVEVQYRLEGSTIWLNTGYRWLGYDFSGSSGEDGLTRFELLQRLGPDEASQLFFDLTGGAVRASGSLSSGKKVSKVKAQMPGKVVKLKVEPGQAVESGQPLLILEAMKMENEIRSPIPGIVQEVRVQEGQAIESGAVLIIVGPKS